MKASVCGRFNQVAVIGGALMAAQYFTATAVAEETNSPATGLEPIRVIGIVPEAGVAPPAPASVSTLTADTISERGIATVREALALIPNVSVSVADLPRAASFSVRGSHEITFHEFTGGRTGVGFYLDDVPCADAYGRDLTLYQVERIDFFKGPQGTAFGVPHSMGVLQVVTRPPGQEWAGGAAYSFGSYQFHQGVAYLSGPVASNLFFGLEGLYARDDGWFEDRTTDASYGKHETASGRARLRWLATERLEFNLTLGVERHDDDPSIYVPSDRTQNPYRLYTSPDAYATGGQNYQALHALWSGDGWQVKSISSHRAADFDDYDPVLLLEVFELFSLPRARAQDVSAWTQEFRAESTDAEALWRWRTGVFFSERDSQLDHFILGLGPWEGRNEFRYQHQDYAAYGETTRTVGEQLELSAGLRLQTTRDRTTSSFEPTALTQSLGGVPFSLDKREDYNGVLPMAAAAWKWTTVQRSYFRFSTGLQPGGLAVAAAGSSDYASERSWHYELGHDASFRDETVRLHAAVFYTDYEDYQSFQFNPAGQTVFNAARAHAVGAEGEVRVQPCAGLELFAGAGYTDARFDEFNSPIGTFDGNRISKIPIGTVNLGGTYRAAWGGFTRLDWRWVGETWWDEGNTVRQEAYSLLDARIGYERGRFGVYLFGRNLFDTEYYTHTYLFQGALAATPGVPQFFGVELRTKF